MGERIEAFEFKPCVSIIKAADSLAAEDLKEEPALTRQLINYGGHRGQNVIEL